MMRMEPRLTQTQKQQLVLTQKMQQAIHILQLSGMELEQYVQEELEQNPVLEVTTSKEEPEGKQDNNNENGDSSDKNEFEEDFDLDAYADRWDFRHQEGQDLSRNTDMDARRDYYERSITKEESLTAHLLAQLRMVTDDPHTLRVGEEIIGDIDERGYLTHDLDTLATDLDVPMAEVERVLDIIQRFEPAGVGARDITECLLLQIEAEYPEEPALKTLVTEHLEELEHRQIPKIAKAMKISPERVEELRQLLSRLNPWPGYEYSASQPQYITPDVIVEKNEETGDFDVYLVNERVPDLRISNQYRQMAKDSKTDKEAKQYVRDRVESAKWIIRNIEQRQATILKVAQAIVDVQRDFFEKGIEHIKPLTLQEIADRVGVHEATVSRTTRGKYMQTPQGLYELKFFFSPGLRRDSGGTQSSKSIQSMIKKLIEEEDKSKPLSDQKIVNKLKEQGINIARRTVTKYREGMRIPATTMRKKY
ncbi:MAG: RNA polymerase factor sigma-54 [Candidatus Hydrogenedentota bacterium]